eukprot:CAMPEP_0117458832 /NCGR_PEP_ID=MMETSP0784-20121206/1145_1 /TAXON_ID=39447 /ORGANISM="" /LENGTH=738 /DNA_ID=CAMNT_0005252385 /DNA_START=37 /DNA_END=2252 /DNA_ORIENTATION=-
MMQMSPQVWLPGQAPQGNFGYAMASTPGQLGHVGQHGQVPQFGHRGVQNAAPFPNFQGAAPHHVSAGGGHWVSSPGTIPRNAFISSPCTPPLGQHFQGGAGALVAGVPATITASQRTVTPGPATRPAQVSCADDVSPVARSKNRPCSYTCTSQDMDAAKVEEVFKSIDTENRGSIGKFALVSAMSRDADVAEFVLPGVDISRSMQDEEIFWKYDTIFDRISIGKKRIRYKEFAAFFNVVDDEADQGISPQEIRRIFKLIDKNGGGFISKFDLVAAMNTDQSVEEVLMPGVDIGGIMTDEWSFDVVEHLFDSISGGKKRIYLSDFEKHFNKLSVPRVRPRTGTDRSTNSIFIIGPGFGRQINPMQGQMIESARFQVHWCSNIPNPEQSDFPVSNYLEQIKAEIDEFKPDVLACASKGGVYLVALWQMGYWRGPTVFINAHPSCKKLPEGVPVVLCHGSNDEVYHRSRHELEQLIGTGTANMCYLYYTANSGMLSSGQLSRVGDYHNMESLVKFDCLPRLIDAVLCPDGPEVHMLRTWSERLSEERLMAERWLGYSPDELQKRWVSNTRRGVEKQKLFEVALNSEEARQVLAAFRSAPKEPPAYMLGPQEAWDGVQIVRLQRVENRQQVVGSVKPYYDATRTSLEDQHIDFEAGHHTRWGFHGAAGEAIDSIILDPVAGFQPLASGTRGASLWGSGTYFARDAKYVAEGGVLRTTVRRRSTENANVLVNDRDALPRRSVA